MSITAALGGIAALGSAVYGAIASSKRNKEAKNLIAEQRKENKDWYNTKMSSDYTQRSDAQAVLKKQRELLAERFRAEKAAQAVAGGTDEDIAAAKQADADSVAQTMTGLAENASSYKDQVEQQYRAQDAALNQQQAAALQAQANATAAAAGQAVNAGIGMMGAAMNADALKSLRETKKLTHSQELDKEENQ